MYNLLSKIYRKPFLIFLDLIILFSSLFLSFYFVYGHNIFSLTNNIFWSLIAIVGLILLYLSHLYNKLWKYASISELYSIIMVSFLLNVFFALYILVFNIDIYMRIVFLNTCLNIVLLGGFRFIIRFISEYMNIVQASEKEKINVLIIGAGDAGEMLIREMRKHPKLNKDIVGLIDDDKSKSNYEVHGKKVLGNRTRIPEIITRYRVEEVIIAMPSAQGKDIKEIYNLSKQNGVKVKIFPGVYEIIEEDFKLNQIREVKVEDLLKRDPIILNTEDIAAYIENKTVLITGGSGSIGSELCRQLAKYKPEKLIVYDINENNTYFLERELKERYKNLKFYSIIGNICDLNKLDFTFAKFKPEVVFHAAAHKHVPLMEYNPEEAIKNNIIGTKNVVEIADKYFVERFVLISTDKAVNPTNIMGATKRITEMIIQSINQESQTKYMAVRFGNVLGSEGSVIPWFKQKIKKREAITVTHPEVKRYFMTIPEASQLVIQAGSLGRGGEVFVLDMGEAVKILDLARDLIILSGLKPNKDIEIKITGLRPGEKLFEELLNDNEHFATEHEKIFITNLEPIDKGKLDESIYHLKLLAEQMDTNKIIDYLVDLVDTYQPNRYNLNKEKREKSFKKIGKSKKEIAAIER